MPRSSSLLPIVSTSAVVALVALMACRTEPQEGDDLPPIETVGEALEVQEELFEFQCECFAQFQGRTVDECIQDERVQFSEDEVSCISEILDADPDSFAILQCESQALSGLLECDKAKGCPGAFDCGDGQMIAETWECDEIPDCFNGADEDDDCRTQMCANGDMILPQWVCDEFPDCLDGGDEVGCPPSFVCTDGQQIPGSWVCDGTVNCPDGVDEDENCPETCERRWDVHLANCGVLDEGVSASINDCLEFTCIDGRVIDSSRKCDGVNDCSEGEDEAFCDEDEGSGSGSSSGG